jgi:TolA-binding protein
MVGVWRYFLVLTLLAGAGPRLFAASPAETRAFEDAARAMSTTDWVRAENLFATFAQEYTNSPQLSEAILYQAEARYQQTNYAGAVQLLNNSLTNAGAWTDQYLFWLGKSQDRQSNYTGAIDAYDKLIKQFPASSRLLEAAIDQASAHKRLGQWSRVTELLGSTNGVFQTAARTNAASEWVPQGYLLLGEAYLEQKNLPGAEAALQPIAKALLKPEFSWQWQYLMCRIQLAEGKTEAALQGCTALLTLATDAGQPKLRADSSAFKAGLLEGLGRFDEAISAYTNNLAPGLPVERQRQALLKITELSLAQNKIGAAAQTLVNFLTFYPDSPSADLAWLTLGELRLRQFESAGNTNLIVEPNLTNSTPTNLIQLAITAFETLTKNSPQSSLIGKGQLDLGWCYWLTGKMPESQKAFQTAVMRLPISPDLARAHFKLADAQFLQGDFTNSITHYNAVIDKFSNIPAVQTNLIEQALYQITRASLSAGDFNVATNALQKIVSQYPNGFYTDRAVLGIGQEISRVHKPDDARKIFSDFVQHAPNASLRPEVELAIARTYEQQSNWKEAIAQYDSWLLNFTNNPSRPRAEYYRALANFRAHNETNALAQFTNLVAQFPTNEFAPLAQWWVADYYYGIGDFTRAENDYQLLAGRWPGSRLAYEATMMAGRMAVARQSWENAKDYFLKLYNDTNCPTDLKFQAFSAYGDYWMSRDLTKDSTNKLADYEQAIRVYTTICETYSTNRLAALAWGQKANCRLQWAQISQDYGPAILDFQEVLKHPGADATARGIAKVGLAVVLEKQAQQKSGAEQTALLRQALDNYTDVFHGVILRDGERPSLFWIKKAGLKAADLAEALKEWSIALNICKQLEELLPQLRASLDKRITNAQEKLRALE